MRDFKAANDGTGTISSTVKTHFLRTMLHGEALIELYVLTGQVGSTTNGHVKLIKESLLRYFPPMDALTNQKRARRRAIREP